MTDDELEAALEAGLGGHRERIRAHQRELSGLHRNQRGYMDTVYGLVDAAEELLAAEEKIPQKLRQRRRAARIRLARAAGVAVMIGAGATAAGWFLGWIGWISAILLLLLTLAGGALALFADEADADITMGRAWTGLGISVASAAAGIAAAFGLWHQGWLFLAAAILMATGMTLSLGKADGSAA